MICGILGPTGCGGTFLDWSLHYLSGQSENLVIKCGTFKRGEIRTKFIQSITDNPLVRSTAHLHNKSHPNTDSLNEVIKQYSKVPYPLNTFYYIDSMTRTQTQTYHNSIVNQYPDVKFITYKFKPHHVDWIFCLQYEKVLIMKRQFTREMFIQQINANIKETNQMSVGELRELLSLYYPFCIKGQILNEELVAADNNYLLDFDRVCTSMPTVMDEIFEFLKLPISQSRYDQWNKIYSQWLEKNSFKFFLDLAFIVECIVQGKYLDLSEYSMSFAKEVVLASKLLYDHNLSLKFEGIQDLSSNTMQWNRILEPNVYHQLSSITG